MYGIRPFIEGKAIECDALHADVDRGDTVPTSLLKRLLSMLR